MSHSRSIAAVVLAFGSLIFVNTVSAQDGAAQQEPALQIKPAAVVQKPDAKTLIEKASYLIGFRFMSSAKQNPAANMEQIFEGMKAAADGKDLSSFFAGYKMMQGVKSNGAELDLMKVRNGMELANAGNQLGMSDEEVQMLMQAFTKMLEEKRVAELKAQSEVNLAAGAAYLEMQRAKNPNLKELENGMYFEVIEEGKGRKPTESDRVTIDYTGRLVNGKVFDSSVAPINGRPPAPATFQVSGVVPGFSKALLSMNEGSKWRVIIPGPMAFGVRGSGSIGPNETLIFEIKLLKIEEAPASGQNGQEPAPEAGGGR